jgi:phosphoribosylaminoimidazolecarboxamide formyltransferase/IMP cyclohydrolase
MRRRAIVSAYDKTGLLEFAARLQQGEWELIASGGTASLLRDGGVNFVDVAAVTGAPEMLSGRVKTLHPAIHGGILARSTESDLQELRLYQIGLIDLVVCNLYPFRETAARPDTSLEDAVEQIDIGGVTLLRAAAKNFARVTVICDPADYEPVWRELQAAASSSGPQALTSLQTRRRLALKAFSLTRDYDAAIAGYLAAAD